MAERLTAAGYVVIVISASLSGQGATRSYTPKPRGQSTLSVLEAYFVGGGSLCRLRRRRRKGEVGTNGEEV